MPRPSNGQCVLFAQPDEPAQPAPPTQAGRSGVRGAGLSLCVLGSGSGGNCTVVRVTGKDGRSDAMLLDSGFGPHRTARKLAEAGLGFEDLAAVCVTHFDQDHFRPSMAKTLVDHGIKLYCHHWHLPDLHKKRGCQKLFDAGLVEPFGDGLFVPMPGTTATTTRLQHDKQGTIGYRISTRFGDVGFATDLGHAPTALIDLFAGVDILCIEANYDQHMTLHSSRPVWTNRRNLSDSGHLSNEQSFAAVRAIADRSPHGNPRKIVLLHRSGQCNHPTKVRRVFEQDPLIARRTIQTQQRRRTRWVTVPPMRQVHRQQLTLAVAR